MLLNNPASMVVVDIKGEAYRVTARRRREMGQAVYVLDPHRLVANSPDRLNPFSLIFRDPEGIEDSALMLAEMLSGGERSLREPFWDDLATSIEAGIIAHLASSEGVDNRSLGRLYEMLCANDVAYDLAVLLDAMGDKMNRFAYGEIAAFLQHEGEKVRSSIRSTAQQHARLFAVPAIQRAVADTTIDLDAFVEGKPMTIYIVMPFAKLASQKALIRLWLTTLINLLASRTHKPETVTHFVVDEMTRLGYMPQIEQAVTLLRSYGVRCVLFVQSLAQLRRDYPNDHQAICDNCGVISTFGLDKLQQCQDMAQMLGDTNAETLLHLPADQCAVKVGKEPTQMLKKVDYLKDAMFKGQYDVNSFYTPQRDGDQPEAARE
jgi:type IV secretion system protein VirD4